MSLVEKPKDRTSTAGQKFWPLKKFNLHNHHGKNIEQPNGSPGQTIEIETTTADDSKSPVNEAQKKSKNTRLSSLLSTNRRQEGTPSNKDIAHPDTSEATVNINDSTHVDDETKKKSETQASTLTKKSAKTRQTTYNKNQKNGNMTAKSAGSGTLTRSQMTGKSSITPSSPPLKQSFFKTKEPKTSRKSPDDKSSKRPHSPPSKRNDSPTQQPPKIMLESVQQQIQKEGEKKIKQIEKLKDEVADVKKDEVPTEPTKKEKKKQGQEMEEECPKQMEVNPSASSSDSSQSVSSKKQRQHSIPSPPATPAAEFIKSEDDTKYNINSQYEPISPTICSFDEQCTNNKVNDRLQQTATSTNSNNNNNANNMVYIQQPIQRIQRLRPAASFATLRQLASTNGNFQYVGQQQPLQQMHQIKKRPVSFIEPSSYSHYNYATQTPPFPPTGDDYLSVKRPIYYRRASSEDNGYYHIRYPSDNTAIQFTTPSPPSSVAGNERRMARPVHNVIIKDGQGHRIVQCVALDNSPPLQPQPLRRKTSSFESNESTQHYQDWSPPPEDETRQPCEDPHLVTLMQQQQQQNMLASVHDTTMVDTTDGCKLRKMKRKDSAKSLSSLCSTSPPVTSYDAKCEQLKSKLEIEKATVRSLQKQKEAISKDLDFLNKNVDELTTENTEWKRKYELEKTNRERFQDDLSDSLEKLSEATEQIRNLEKQNKHIKSELEEKVKELEKKTKQMTSPVPRGKPGTEGKSNERLLAAQLQHSQNQVKLLKSTMEQFLRMGLFNDDFNATSPTTSIDAIVSEIKCGRSRQRRSSAISSKSNSSTTNGDVIVVGKPKSRKPLDPQEKIGQETTQQQQPTASKSTPTAELDIQLRELLREKEILQAEYSKAPSSGGNALVRRRREELESRLDAIDSQMCRIKLKLRNRNIL